MIEFALKTGFDLVSLTITPNFLPEPLQARWSYFHVLQVIGTNTELDLPANRKVENSLLNSALLICIGFAFFEYSELYRYINEAVGQQLVSQRNETCSPEANFTAFQACEVA